jgi:hypothetical protein
MRGAGRHAMAGAAAGLAAFSAGLALAGPREAPAAEVLFATKVLPLLRSRCFACHGEPGKAVLGGLNLSTRARLLAGGAGGRPSVVPGDPAASPLYRAALRTDATYAPMPPKENDRLAPEDLAALREWIAGGEAVRTSGGLSPEWTNRGYRPEDLWAYRPLRRPPVPAGAPNPVDAFLGARLRTLGLKPAPPADRRTLIRRVTFDLTGLPPTPAEVEAFLADRASDAAAFGRVVDRLLASPHYGEQMARHWLDVARYADSAGFANDYERGSAWRYRDYVVRSFNADKPYPRFVREQLAGDELDPGDPEMLVAAGFLRMGAWELTGMEVPRIARQRFLDDVTDSVGQVFLGHMLQCARCHDHKFDPVPTRDYYGIQAAFATTQLAERPAPFLPTENTAGFEERRYLDLRRQEFEEELRRIQAVETAARRAWEAAHPERRGEKPPRHEFLSPADLGLERIARKGLERLRWEYDRYEPFALSVYSGGTPALKAVYAPLRPPADPTAGEVEATAILIGGDPFAPGEAVRPGVLSAAGPGAIPAGVVGRRRALAEWITAPENPLTARVMANRVWQWAFGAPLAGNPNNLGATGKKPTHPALLDWLAADLAQHGSVKRLLRVLLTSAAYRRASRHPDPASLAARDPLGTSHAVFTARRLSAEELRDSMLAVSGELNPALGGIPVRPELHPEIALQPRQVMGTFAPAWEASPRPEQRHRRTLYALRLRGVRDPLLEVFNAPTPDLSCERRESATIAPQAFTLLNGAHTRARALAFAARIHAAAPAPKAALDLAFRLAYARPPTAAERTACLAHWRAMTDRHRGQRFEKPTPPRQVRREAVEENTGERFHFTERLVSAADFVPDLHPADASAEARGLMEVCLVLLNANEFLYLD